MRYLQWLRKHGLQLISAAIILVLLAVTFSMGDSRTPQDDLRVQDTSSVETVSVSSAEEANTEAQAILQVPASGSSTGPAIPPPEASASGALRETDAETQATPTPSAAVNPTPTAAPTPIQTAETAGSTTAEPTAVQTPQATEDPTEAPPVTDEPEVPETPWEPDVPEVPVMPESPESPENPESPESPSAAPEPTVVPSPAPTQVPEPTEPPAPSEEPRQPVCTISICCQTALDNAEKCKDGVLESLPEDGWILPAVTVPIQEGDTVFDILQRVCRDYDIAMEYSGGPSAAYIEGIGNLYEFDVGQLSGWMYCVNEKFPNYGCSGYTVSDGDVICWRYTCDLGTDVGGGNW